MVYLVVKNTHFCVGMMAQGLGTLITFAKGLPGFNCLHVHDSSWQSIIPVLQDPTFYFDPV